MESPANVCHYTDNWASLTVDNFYVGSTGCNAEGHTAYPASIHGFTNNINAYVSKSYNASTGILTFGGIDGTWNSSSGDFIKIRPRGITFAVLVLPN